MRVTKFEFHRFESFQGGSATEGDGWDADFLNDFGQADAPLPSESEQAPFDVISEPEPEAEPVTHAVTEALLANARQEGYQQGFHDGRTEGLEEGRNKGHAEGLAEGLQHANEREQAAVSQQEKQLAQSLKQLSAQFATLFGDAERQQAEAPDALCRMAFSIARKIVGYELQHNAIATVRQYLTDSLRSLSEWNKVTVEVSPELLADLQGHLQSIQVQAGFRGQIELLPSPAMQPGDCRVNWQSGSAERLIEDVTQRIAGLMQWHLGDAPAPQAQSAAPEPTPLHPTAAPELDVPQPDSPQPTDDNPTPVEGDPHE